MSAALTAYVLAKTREQLREVEKQVKKLKKKKK